jgi:hypothetical protein
MTSNYTLAIVFVAVLERFQVLRQFHRLLKPTAEMIIRVGQFLISGPADPFSHWSYQQDNSGVKGNEEMPRNRRE